MMNRKTIAMITSIVMAATSAAAFQVMAAEQATEGETSTGVYSVYNVTGEKLSELYLYETGENKGENLISDGLRNNKKMVLTYEGTEDTTLTLAYVTESGDEEEFSTLHIEEVPIALMTSDAVSGATPISFEIPQGTGNYTIENQTGEEVTELYIYPAEKEETAEEASEAEELGEEQETEEVSEAEDSEAAEEIDKGENLAGEGLADGESLEYTYTGDVDTELIVEFTTETDGMKHFDTLHIETATIGLLAADDMSGATPISLS